MSETTAEPLTRRVEHPGETGWNVEAPEVPGYEPTFVGRVGGSHTTWSYRPKPPEQKKLFDVTLRRTYTEKGQGIWPDAKRKPEQDSSHPEWAFSEQEVWDYWAEIHGKPYPYWDEKYKDSVVAVVEVSPEDLAERRSKAWNYRFGGVCCELAVFSPCVCSYKTVCPVHGSHCHGTHD